MAGDVAVASLSATANLKTFEQEVVASASSSAAQGDPDFWIEADELSKLDGYLQQIEQQLADAHDQTGWHNVRNAYGFTGRGQTVAVIDSGIAYDHFALGGGLGSNYRVVGGWDFSEENDPDPYDDGGAGGHGTHVSGIIGNNSNAHPGVAPGVDLVALRVFNDAGAGYFSWVESALRWVYDNRNSFANPITTVNLSLGVSSWNSSAVPQWAMLEDEFAQLESAGIFIAVAAGNSFASHDAAGLSYPAASQYVVPVMATDDAGFLSNFSQRLGRAIAAPGRGIVSAVPDYKGDRNGVADDFKNMSGTSMAAPYVAGASVLIREAMQFVGMTNITQDGIYSHMMATADTIYDSFTSTSYKRLNLEAAIEALMPEDDYGSSIAEAYDLGTLKGSTTVNGVIGTKTDADFFRFTAGSDGKVSFKLTEGHNISAEWTVYDQFGAVVSASTGDDVEFSVAEGASYSVRLASSLGTGAFTCVISTISDFEFQDWGLIDFQEIAGIAISGEQWFRVQATRTGILTVQAAYNAALGNVHLEMFDANLTPLNTVEVTGQAGRVDVDAVAGECFFVRVFGQSPRVQFSLVNLLTNSGSSLEIAGTAGNDTLWINAQAGFDVTINEVNYRFAADEVSSVSFVGNGGRDWALMIGSADDQSATLRHNSAVMSSAAYDVSISDVPAISIIGGGGDNEVTVYDTPGDDLLSLSPSRVTLTGTGAILMAARFNRIAACASTGFDRAEFSDSAGDELFETWSDRAQMTGSAFSLRASGFDEYIGTSTGGSDRAVMHDSAGNDYYRAWADDYAQMTTAASVSYARNFSKTTAFASTGFDRAALYDSTANNLVQVRVSGVSMSGRHGQNEACGFDYAAAVSSGGIDSAEVEAVDYLFDLVGDWKKASG